MCVGVWTNNCVWLFRPHGLYVACQTPLSMEFSRQEYWSGLPFPLLGDLIDPGIESTSPASPTLAGGFFTTSAMWEVLCSCLANKKFSLDTLAHPFSQPELCTCSQIFSWVKALSWAHWPLVISQTNSGYWCNCRFLSVWLFCCLLAILGAEDTDEAGSSCA